MTRPRLTDGQARFHAASTIRQALAEGARRIEGDTDSDEATLEAELLLCHALGIGRTRLYQRLNDDAGEAAEEYAALITRRCAHEPTPYITGHRESFEIDFEVSPAALIPRPETETLVEAVIGFATERFGARPFTIADIGVGCGTIAVAVSHALPNARVNATDESADALSLARRNAEKHGVDNRIEFRPGDLLDPLTEAVDIIAANLPYVTTTDWEALPPEIREWEPRAALDGGTDGLRVIEPFLRAAPAHVLPGGAVFAEIGDTQADEIRRIATEAFPEAAIEVKHDLAGKARVLVVRLQ
jgi:release factor glutamine methyltransferase